MHRLATLSGTLALSAACAHAEQPVPQAAPSERAPVPRESPGGQLQPSRAFASDATFGELVATLQAEDSLSPSGARCLLFHTGTAYRFEGTPSVALQPLPPAVEELDQVMQRAPALRVLTRRGSFGSADATLGFVALTESPATRDAVVLAVTDQALYVRGLDESPAFIAASAQQAAQQLGTRSSSASIYVAAEARVPLSRVYEVLAQLAPLPQPVVLASALPADVTLPRPADKPRAAARCPEGLPATEAVEGDLSVAELMHGVEPLRVQAAECLRRADGPGAAGGRMTLALRIDARGRVADTCVVASDVDDDALTACVLAMARELTFAPPSPEGVVDAELPLALRSEDVARQAPVCETETLRPASE